MQALEVWIRPLSAGGLQLNYRVTGDIAALSVPSPRKPGFVDGLWQHTCFELFVACGERYDEYNFSPSGEWAAYGFSRYRERDHERVVCTESPSVRLVSGEAQLDLEVALSPVALLADCPEGVRIGFSAVLESSTGELSYWALRHTGDKPDFHQSAGFDLSLDTIQSMSRSSD